MNSAQGPCLSLPIILGGKCYYLILLSLFIHFQCWIRETWSKTAPGPAHEQLCVQWDRQMLISTALRKSKQSYRRRRLQRKPRGEENWCFKEKFGDRGGARKDAFGNKEEMLEEQSRQRKQHGQRLGDEIELGIIRKWDVVPGAQGGCGGGKRGKAGLSVGAIW